MSCYSFKSDEEESIAATEDSCTLTSSQKKAKSLKRLAIKEKKPVVKKPKKSLQCYTDKITDLIVDESIQNDSENTLTIKKDECSLTIKTPMDVNAVDYWTITHYKSAKIANVAPKDRWKHAECSLKMALTEQQRDDLLSSNDLIVLIQSVFDRFMRHPKKKLMRHNPK